LSSSLFATLPTGFSQHTLTLLAINGVIFWVVVKIIPGLESTCTPCTDSFYDLLS
jgi:hypothetical protein